MSYNQKLRYRLKIIQKNSEFYTNPVQLYIENPVSQLELLAHPTQKKQFLQFKGLMDSNGKINLYHADGNLAVSKSIQIQKGKNEIEIPLQNQATGAYYLQFKAPHKNWITRVLNIAI